MVRTESRDRLKSLPRNSRRFSLQEAEACAKVRVCHALLSVLYSASLPFLLAKCFAHFTSLETVQRRLFDLNEMMRHRSGHHHHQQQQQQLIGHKVSRSEAAKVFNEVDNELEENT